MIRLFLCFLLNKLQYYHIDNGRDIILREPEIG